VSYSVLKFSDPSILDMVASLSILRPWRGHFVSRVLTCPLKVLLMQIKTILSFPVSSLFYAFHENASEKSQGTQPDLQRLAWVHFFAETETVFLREHISNVNVSTRTVLSNFPSSIHICSCINRRPDYVLATAEEAHRKRCIKKGTPYKSLLQVREVSSHTKT
jgi:hypothetical protein